VEVSHPEQGTLHAWVEGELDGAEHQRIEAHLAECARCREAVAEARGLIAGASRIVAALDGAPAGVVPSRLRRPRFAPARWAAAAAVLLFAATSVVVSREIPWRGDELQTTVDESAAPSERDLSASPVVAPVVADQPAVANTNPAAVRRSTTQAAREPISTGERTSAGYARAGAARSVDGRGEFSQRAGGVAAAPGAVRNESDLAGTGVTSQAADQIATAAPTMAPPPSPPPAIPSPAEPRQSSERSQRMTTQPLGAVVATGAAAGSAGSGAARVVRVVRYEARPGVIVTLTEYEERPQPGRAPISVRGQARAQVSAAQPESQEQSTAAVFSGERSYMWRDPERARFYVLRGALPVNELESLARRLGELKVVR
jgi:hypothetical protein